MFIMTIFITKISIVSINKRMDKMLYICRMKMKTVNPENSTDGSSIRNIILTERNLMQKRTNFMLLFM